MQLSIVIHNVHPVFLCSVLGKHRPEIFIDVIILDFDILFMTAAGNRVTEEVGKPYGLDVPFPDQVPQTVLRAVKLDPVFVQHIAVIMLQLYKSAVFFLHNILKT